MQQNNSQFLLNYLINRKKKNKCRINPRNQENNKNKDNNDIKINKNVYKKFIFFKQNFFLFI